MPPTTAAGTRVVTGRTTLTDETAGAEPVEQLHRLLAMYPEARLSATSSEGLPMAVPEGIPTQATHTRATAVGVRAWAPEDRAAVVDAFDQARQNGTSEAAARLANDPTIVYTLYLLDVRPLYGAMITVAIGQPGATASRRLLEVGTDSEPPRLARVTKSDVGTILAIDDATTKILGWTTEETIGHRSLEFIHPDDHALALENWFELLATPGPSRRVRLRHRSRSGAWIWLETTNNNRLQEREQCVLSEMVDISKEMAAQELLSRLTQALPLGVFQIEGSRQIVYSNSLLLEMLDLKHAESVAELLHLATPASREAFEEAVDAVLWHAADRDLEVELQLPGHQQHRHYQLNLRSLTKQPGSATGAIGCLTDITERVLLRRELEHRATYDTLTGCRNRQSITAGLQALLATPGRSGTGVAVFFIDLDRFKEVNDTLGHASGDELLILVADRLRGLIREHDLLGRLGGDEFLLVCPRLPDENAALLLGGRIAGALTGDVPLSTGTVPLSASIGIAWTSPGQLDEEELVHRADTAMYAAKRRGTGQPQLSPTGTTHTQPVTGASQTHRLIPTPTPAPRPGPKAGQQRQGK
jgi:diguanylate cyclase (GGDEF)-like protein/PAS domain S-box-containing protein